MSISKASNCCKVELVRHFLKIDFSGIMTLPTSLANGDLGSEEEKD